MPFDMQPVKSSNVESSAYDPDSQTLRVQFKGGRQYDYHGVTAEVHSTLMEAPSFGSYLANVIRPSHPASLVDESRSPQLPKPPEEM